MKNVHIVGISMRPGVNAMILEIFLPQNGDFDSMYLEMKIDVEKNRLEVLQKLLRRKIVIITLTPVSVSILPKPSTSVLPTMC
jgi:hypothetical protein